MQNTDAHAIAVFPTLHTVEIILLLWPFFIEKYKKTPVNFVSHKKMSTFAFAFE